MGKRSNKRKGTTQKMERVNRGKKWAKRETWLEGKWRGKREERSGKEKRAIKKEIVLK
jgi:hypothetical protein